MKIIFTILSLAMFSGCVVNPEPIVTGKNIVISHVGFFNSEGEDFKPKQIGYSALVDFSASLTETSNHLLSLGYQVSDTKQFESGLGNLDRGNVELLSSTIETLLSELNQSLMTGENKCTECINMRFVSLANLPNFSHWGELDSVVLFLGLESRSPAGRSLRSGLAAIRFDSEGRFKKYSFVSYDFTKYSTAGMIRDSKILLDSIL